MDFNVYYEAVKVVFAGGNPYLHLITMPGPFNYPPIVFLFISLVTNKSFFDVLSAVAFFISIFLLTRKKLFVSCFLFLVSSLIFFPYKFNHGMGQINNFILLFIVLAYYHNPFFLAYAIGIKLVPAVYLFYYLIKKEHRMIFLVICYLILLFFLSLVVIKWDFQKVYYFDIFWRAFRSGGKEVYYNQSLAGLLSRANTTLLFYPLSILLAFITWSKGRKLNKDRVFSAVTCLMLMLNPIAWQHHFVFAVIPIIFLFNLNKFLVTVSYLLIAWNFKNPNFFPADFNLILSTQFWGTLILWVLALFAKETKKILVYVYAFIVIFIYLRFLLCKGSFCF